MIMDVTGFLIVAMNRCYFLNLSGTDSNTISNYNISLGYSPSVGIQVCGYK